MIPAVQHTSSNSSLFVSFRRFCQRRLRRILLPPRKLFFHKLLTWLTVDKTFSCQWFGVRRSCVRVTVFAQRAVLPQWAVRRRWAVQESSPRLLTFFLGWRTFSARDALELARELVKVHQFRPQLSFAQAPRVTFLDLLPAGAQAMPSSRFLARRPSRCLARRPCRFQAVIGDELFLPVSRHLSPVATWQPCRWRGTSVGTVVAYPELSRCSSCPCSASICFVRSFPHLTVQHLCLA